MDFQEKLTATKKRLDAVSPSFCLAKWLQVTLHLQDGFNHSCHHPNVHKASLEEIALDPSALHNTGFKKNLRAMMLRGERPAECEYCWRVEDTASDQYSDRVIKSSDNWASPSFEAIARADAGKNVNPTYLEVSFGSECNFRCSYCSPNISSSIWNSYEKHGAYVARDSLDQLREQGRIPLKAEGNPYIAAFWEWFPSLAPDLKVFRITGGEPLVNSNTFRVLEYIEANPLPNLQLCINSNLGVPEPRFRKFLDKLKSLSESGKIKNFLMYTSIDTHGAHAEYLRVGLNYETWLERVRTYLREVPFEIHFMGTFNALSVPRFTRLLEDLLAINREFIVTRDGGDFKRTFFDISHLQHPDYFSVWVLNDRWVAEIARIAEFMEAHAYEKIGVHGFNEYEIHKMKRIAVWAEATKRQPDRDGSHFRALFYLFTNQFAEREGKKFLDVFPEMEDYYRECEQDLASKGDAFDQYRPIVTPPVSEHAPV